MCTLVCWKMYIKEKQTLDILKDNILQTKNEGYVSIQAIYNKYVYKDKLICMAQCTHKKNDKSETCIFLYSFSIFFYKIYIL